MFRKSDIILIITLIIVTIASFFIILDTNKKDGENVTIKIDGIEFKKVPLITNNIIEYDENGIYFKAIVQDKKVHMEENNCKDKHCIRQGKISRHNEIIVCLPNKITIEVTDNKNSYDSDEVDIIIK